MEAEDTWSGLFALGRVSLRGRRAKATSSELRDQPHGRIRTLIRRATVLGCLAGCWVTERFGLRWKARIGQGLLEPRCVLLQVVAEQVHHIRFFRGALFEKANGVNHVASLVVLDHNYVFLFHALQGQVKLVGRGRADVGLASKFLYGLLNVLQLGDVNEADHLVVLVFRVVPIIQVDFAQASLAV